MKNVSTTVSFSHPGPYFITLPYSFLFAPSLQSIDSTEILVKQMSVALEELQPVLIKTSEETEVRVREDLRDMSS